MKWIGYKQVKASAIVLPGDVRKRTKLPRVVELAADIRELGDEPIHAPTVLARGMKLIAGRDRMAALLLNKAKRCWVRLCEATTQEAADLEVSENLYRRADDRDELIARRVRKVVEQLSNIPLPNSGPGRPKSALGAAREKVARELGTTKRAIEQAERRAAAEEDPPSPDESIAQAAELPPPVCTWGVPVDHLAQEFAALRIAQEALNAADRYLQQAQRALSGLRDGGTIASTLYSRVYTAVHTAADIVRRANPDALCPYCKGLMHRRALCSGCGGLGYVGQDATDGIAAELTRNGAEAVVVDGSGGFEPIASARVVRDDDRGGLPLARVHDGVAGVNAAGPATCSKAPPKPQPKPAKRIRIEDDAGNDLTPDEDVL